jgi:hypothetical protein
MYYSHPMRLNMLLIVSLLVIVTAAPIVDALACDDCNDIAPLRGQQRVTKGINPSDGKLLSSDADRPAPQGTATAQDLCPVCSDTAAAIGNAYCCAPSMISHTKPLPKLIALSSPSYPINKPPQN